MKNAYVGRTFIQPSQTIRQLGIRLKLNPLREVIRGKRLIVVDDSIVRGNTQRALVRMLREAGAVEVHVRIASPPVRWPCFYGIDFAARAELIANASADDLEAVRRRSAPTRWHTCRWRPDRGLRAARDAAVHRLLRRRYPIELPDEARRQARLEHMLAMTDRGSRASPTRRPVTVRRRMPGRVRAIRDRGRLSIPALGADR